MKIPFLGQTYVADTPTLSNQRSINLYFEKGPEDGASLGAMVTVPGEVSWTTAGSGAGCRGYVKMKNKLYVVYGTSLYYIDTGGTANTLGTIEGTARVIIAQNGTQLVVVADEKSYVYSARDGSFSQITDPNFLRSSSVCYLDGYFIFTQYQTNQFFLSPLLDDATGESDFTAFDATDRARAFTQGGNLIAGVADHKELWLFKDDNTIEVWQNTGGDFPLTRLGGAYTQRGCVNKHTITQEDNSLFWLGDDKVIYRANGYVPLRVSNFDIEVKIAKMSFIGDAFAHAWTERGHKMIAFTFPSEQKTFVLDVATQLWHERQSYDYGYWRVNGVIDCYGKLIVTDSESNKIGELDYDTFQEYGGLKQAIRIGQTLHAEGSMFSLDRLEVLCESGVGLESGQGSDPEVALYLSKDHGNTFGTMKKRSLGKLGDYAERAVWRNQGLYRQLTPKILITDPVRRYIIDAYAELTPRRI